MQNDFIEFDQSDRRRKEKRELLINIFIMVWLLALVMGTVWLVLDTETAMMRKGYL